MKFLIKTRDKYVHKYATQDNVPIDSRQNLDSLLLADDQVYYY